MVNKASAQRYWSYAGIGYGVLNWDCLCRALFGDWARAIAKQVSVMQARAMHDTMLECLAERDSSSQQLEESTQKLEDLQRHYHVSNVATCVPLLPRTTRLADMSKSQALCCNRIWLILAVCLQTGNAASIRLCLGLAKAKTLPSAAAICCTLSVLASCVSCHRMSRLGSNW